MGRQMLAQLGSFRPLLNNSEHGLRTQGLIGSCTGKQPWFRFLDTPVLAQGFQQNRRQHDNSVLVPLALLNCESHPGGVDNADAQMNTFGTPQAGSKDRRQQSSALAVWGRL